MELLTYEDLEVVNGGDRETYQTVLGLITTAVTGGNGYAGLAVGYFSGKHYDYLEKKYENHRFNPSTYQHPYRKLN
ncbi:MAG: hypothetical protein CVU98_11555 [Firmicutes bacterium HGW-Firmicutes-3]|jgi:hypothetical protein|nr:MAG: hypothetical protein CVU98_11555 [Firmicutes bacterium HGW-Firmicutes-3]